MNCTEARDRIDLLGVGLLDEPQHDELSTHLDDCAGCQREADTLRQVVAGLREDTRSDAAEAPLSDAVVEKALSEQARRVHPGPDARPPRPTRPRSVVPFIMGFAIAALGAAAWQGVYDPPIHPSEIALGDPLPDPPSAEKLPPLAAEGPEVLADAMAWVEPGRALGDPAPGFRLGGLSVVPRRVAVRGPRSRLAPSYQTLPFDLGGADRDFEIDCALDTAQGVAGPRVRVRVQILPDLVSKTIEFPVSIVLPAGDKQVDPLPYRIHPRDGHWRVGVELHGPAQALRDLEDELDRARLAPTDAVLPLAHVPPSALPRRVAMDRELDLRVEVVGLPAGVKLVEPPLLRVILIPIE